MRDVLERLLARGFDVGVVSGTHVDNVDGQLAARPTGPGRLFFCLNRGSEVFAVDADGPRLVHRRVATLEEDAALTAAAELTVERLAARGLRASIVAQRLNRRKVDLIPEPEWADPPKARIGELVEAVESRLRAAGIDGLPAVVELAREAAAEVGLPDPRVTSDAKHVEVGLTDKSDSIAWLLEELWRRGIGPRDVLIGGDELGPLGGVEGSDSLMLVPAAGGSTVVSVGVEPLGVPEGVIMLGGGPDRFVELLEDQLARREQRDLLPVEGEPGWALALDGLDPVRERARAALFTLADGLLGTTGSVVAHRGPPAPVYAAVFDGEGSETSLLQCPAWNLLPGDPDGGSIRRVLDLHAGLVRQDLRLEGGGRLSALLFSSFARPGSTVLRAEGPRQVLAAGEPLAVVEPSRTEVGRQGRVALARIDGSAGAIAIAAAEERLDVGPLGRLDRMAVYRADRTGDGGVGFALPGLAEAERAGFEQLLVEHRSLWAERWETADIVIEGDPELQLAVRFSLFQMMASVADSGEAAVGARGLSGSAYRGHVFWDADVFVLPFLAATHPQAARAMLEYRIRRLPAAQQAAKEVARAGARFPWESASLGNDVTPLLVHDRSGQPIPIRTGTLEEHVTADVAWAAACYVDWTGDEEFAAGPGRTLFIETARYWASRIRRDSEGRGHIYGVIGPDEYHEPVDDNVFTNLMARWNLRRAAELPGLEANGVSAQERERWLEVAASLVDNYDPASGLYEQFSGFFDLDPLVVEGVLPRLPMAGELLIGREKVRTAQIVKQTDVLMLHQLVPEEVVPGSLRSNLLFYESRTTHGSSLSPGIHAALFARAGMLDEALELLRIASRIDLDDLTGSTDQGLHLATMGSIWHALALGFAGLRPTPEALRVDPRLPAAWSALEVRLRYRGSRVRIRVEHDALTIVADPGAPVLVAGTPGPVLAGPGGARFEHRGDGWAAVQESIS